MAVLLGRTMLPTFLFHFYDYSFKYYVVNFEKHRKVKLLRCRDYLEIPTFVVLLFQTGFEKSLAALINLFLRDLP